MTAERTQEQRVRREKAKLKRLLRDVAQDKRAAVDSLISNVAFMTVTLADLQAHINAHGVVSEYQNGENQWGTKKSPQAEVYAQLMQRYLPAMRQLLDLAPAEAPTDGDKPGARLMGWIEGDERPQ